MKKKRAVIAMLVAITLFFPVWIGGQQAQATDINILPYFAAGHVGDFWTYAFISPQYQADFTAYLTQVTSGPGKYRLGDYVDIIDFPHLQFFIFDLDAGGIYFYATEQGVFPQPVTFNAVQTLDLVVPSPFPGDTTPLYFQRIPSLTVLAGTFRDVLVHINLGPFGPTKANTTFGLDTLTQGVTHVTWMAAGRGRIQDRDYNDQGDILFEYQLKATSVNSFNPAIPLLLLDDSGQQVVQ